jgi:5-bromo-4-chloroindolyl phosphate hydrolysis protein
MAIQPKRIPTPSEVNNTPKTFDEKELNQLKDLKNKINELTAQFGQLALNKLKFEKIEQDLKNQLSNLEEEESKLAKNLSDKYGKGSIDLDSGTFTPMD